MRWRLNVLALGDVANTQRKVPLDHDLVTTARDIGICFGDR